MLAFKVTCLEIWHLSEDTKQIIISNSVRDLFVLQQVDLHMLGRSWPVVKQQMYFRQLSHFLKFSFLVHNLDC